MAAAPDGTIWVALFGNCCTDPAAARRSGSTIFQPVRGGPYAVTVDGAGIGGQRDQHRYRRASRSGIEQMRWSSYPGEWDPKIVDASGRLCIWDRNGHLGVVQ
jgi:hypothetical protein